MARVVRTRQARADLIDIWRYVAQHDRQAADRLLLQIDVACDRLRHNPELGPARDEIRPGLRYLIVGQYLVLYRRVDDDVEVVRVVHGRRDLFNLT